MRVSKPPEERRAELLAAARRLFDLNGTAKTRVSDIVQSVGVSQGVFYYYFASKEEIVQAVVKQVAAELRQKLEDILYSQLSFYQKMAEFLLLYINTVDQFTGDNEQSVPAGEDQLIYESLLTQEDGEGMLNQALQTLLRQGVQQGAVAIAYPLETASILLHGLRAYAMVQMPRPAMIFTIVEQSFQFPPGALVAFCPG